MRMNAHAPPPPSYARKNGKAGSARLRAAWREGAARRRARAGMPKRGAERPPPEDWRQKPYSFVTLPSASFSTFMPDTGM